MTSETLNLDLFSVVTKKEVKGNINRLFGNSNNSNSFRIENVVARCGCYLCQTRNLSVNKTYFNGPHQPDYVVDPDKAGVTLDAQAATEKIGDFPAALNVNDKPSLVLDSLSALNSPLIDSLLINAKWGDIDPDSGE